MPNSIEKLLYKKVAEKIEDGECKKLDEAKKPTKPAGKKPTKPAGKKPNVSSEMAPIKPKARQTAFDLMSRVMLGLGSLGEEKIPEVIVKRRIAGGMNPKEAATKKLGFKGKHPGKG